MNNERYDRFRSVRNTASPQPPRCRTGDVFIPPHIEHDPLDSEDNAAARRDREEQPQRPKRRRTGKKRRNLRRRRQRRLMAIGAVLAVLLTWLILRVAAVPFGTLRIDGNETLTAEDIYRSAGVPGYVNVVQLSPDVLQERLSHDLRIASVTVQREFPAAIRITLTERKAAAVVMTVYGFAYVDAAGTVIDVQPRIEGVSVPIMTGRKVDTLLLGDTIGDGAMRDSLTYLQNLPPERLQQIAEINIGNPEHIVAYTTDSLPIHLGRGDRPAERAAITDELLREIDDNALSVQYIDTDPRAPLVKSK